MPYCSKRCAKEDWAQHKLACAHLRQGKEEAREVHEAQGGRKKGLTQQLHGTMEWFNKVPGLSNEIVLLAWKYRQNSPYILASTHESDDDGSGITIETMQRSFWEDDPRFLDKFTIIQRDGLRTMFANPLFRSDKEYVSAFRIVKNDHQDKPNIVAHATCSFGHSSAITGVKIVEALTSAMRAEDLADAFAWYETFYPSHMAQSMVQYVRHRAELLHGSTTLHGSVPVPSRGLNNEVAYRIMYALALEFEICLIGLRGAAHFNGREGVISSADPLNHERWKVRLDDGTCVSVKAANFVHLRRGDYKRSPS
jgi:hypothetical protein